MKCQLEWWIVCFFYHMCWHLARGSLLPALLAAYVDNLIENKKFFGLGCNIIVLGCTFVVSLCLMISLLFLIQFNLCRVWCISVRLLTITLMHKFNFHKSMTIKIEPLFNFKCTKLTLCNSCILYQVCWITPRCVYQSRQKYFFKFHCSTMLTLTFIDLLINCTQWTIKTWHFIFHCNFG